MRSASVAFLLSTLVAAVLTPLVRKLAYRFNFLDRAENSRKIHGRPIPRIGGIAIIVGFFTPLLALALYRTEVGKIFYAQRKSAWALLISGVVVGLLGIYDDVKGANARKKFLVQSALAVLLFACGLRIDRIVLPFGYAVGMGPLALPLTVIWIVGVINALNLIDGMDGLAGGVALFAVGTNFMIAAVRGDPLMVLFMACLGGAVLGFLFYNFNPASIFMGDTGSLFLGLVLAVTSLQTNQKSSTTFTLLVPIVTLGLPIADTLLAMGRRALRGSPLFSADKEHIHHLLLARGYSQKKAVLTLYGACIILAVAALLLTMANDVQAAVILTLLSVIFILAVRQLGFLKLGRSREISARRRKNKRLRDTVRKIARQLPFASDETETWALVESLHVQIGASRLWMRYSDPIGRQRTFEVGRPASGSVVVVAEVDIGDDVGSLGILGVEWEDGREGINRDDEIALEVLSDHLAQALRRLFSLTSRVTSRGRALRQ